jgi:hypothetical protein
MMMKTKLMTLILLLSLSGCALAKTEVPTIDQERESIPIGVYVVIKQDSFSSEPSFDINNNNQTFFIQEEKLGENNETYSFSRASGQFFESHTHIHVNDDEDKTVFTASLPVFSDNPQFFRLNIIYKDNQNQYFTQPGHLYYMEYGGGLKFEHSTTEVINGVSKKKTIVFDITLKPFDPLESLQLIMMDENYEIIESIVVSDQYNIEIQDHISYVLIEETRLNIEQVRVKILTMVDAKTIKVDQPYLKSIITSSKHPQGYVIGLNLFKGDDN